MLLNSLCSLEFERFSFSLQEFVLDKVLNLNGPLLKDSTMLVAVSQSKGVIQMAQERETEAKVQHILTSLWLPSITLVRE